MDGICQYFWFIIIFVRLVGSKICKTILEFYLNLFISLLNMNNTTKCLSPLIKSAALKNYLPILSRNLSSGSEDVMTHTGQQWDKKDYRLVRYMNAPKQVNPNWAVNLIAGIPPREVTDRVVWCDGGSGPEGHPRVYINLDKPGNHSCGYCGLRFVKKDGHH